MHELITYHQDIFQSGISSDGALICPTCGTGKVVPGTTSGFRCSNHPVCKFRAAICPECKAVPLQRKADKEGKVLATCSNTECGSQHDACPSCRSGVLIKKSGRHGDFSGCHLFTTTGCKGKGRYVSDRDWRI